MDCIILTAEQVDKVRGKYGLYNELQPILLRDNTYVLPADVLENKTFDSVNHFLSQLPQREVAESEFIVEGQG